MPPSTSDKKYGTSRPLLGVILIAILLGVPIYRLNHAKETPITQLALEGETMGTTYHITIVPEVPGQPPTENLPTLIANTLENVNAQMSTWREDSELSRLNQAPAGESFPLSPQLNEVLRIARDVVEQSRGAFDPTVGPLVNLWGFGPEGQPESTPTPEQIADRMAYVGFEKLGFDASASTVTKKFPQLYCDLSAIAKGYGVDMIANLLEAQGLTNYLIEIGGEIRVSGHNPDGLPWRVGIERPVDNARALQNVLPINTSAIATSGDYRNYYEADGQRLSHTIDPATGHPITHTLASVTVLHAQCAYADAYATALMVMGWERGMKLAREIDLPALFLLRESDGTFREERSQTYPKAQLD